MVEENCSLTTASTSGYCVKLLALPHVSEIVDLGSIQIGSDVTSSSINRIKNIEPRIMKLDDLL